MMHLFLYILHIQTPVCTKPAMLLMSIIVSMDRTPHPQPLALTTLRDLMVYGRPNPDPQEPPPPRAEPSLTTQISPNVRPLQAVQSNTGPYAQSSTHGWYSGVLQWESMGDL